MAKKGQGALEFLMTYGWAFLVILIMIGALAYFGILNPTRFLPDRCDFGTQVLCQKGQYIINNAETQTVLARVTNNFGTQVSVFGFGATTDAAGGTVNCNAAVDSICFETSGDNDCVAADDDALMGIAVGDAVVWNEGQTMNLQLDCVNGDALTEGDKVKFIITYKYFESSAGSTFTRDGRGEIYSQVQ